MANPDITDFCMTLIAMASTGLLLVFILFMAMLVLYGIKELWVSLTRKPKGPRNDA